MNKVHPFVFKVISAFLTATATVFMFLWLSSIAYADPNECPIGPNPGQCLCHNFDPTTGNTVENCPSEKGVENGHDCHLDCFCCTQPPPLPPQCDPNQNGGIVIDCDLVGSCAVIDKFGKCSGCGNGILETNLGEECDDANNVNGDGCDADCKLECANDAECADSNPCTDDSCSPSTFHCVHTNNTASCDADGDACTENDICSGGVCTPGSPKDCGDGLECTTDACDPDTGNCSHDPSGCECTTNAQCNDNNVCTDDVCNLQTFACEHTNNTASCDDSLFCNGVDTCKDGSCGHAGNPCTQGGECDNLCNEDSNNCHVPAGTACGDDENVCTADECNGEGDCVHSSNTAACDDKNACTLNDVCSGGECTPGTPKDCGDGIECTTDSCDPATGDCSHDPSGCECTTDAQCNDNNVCTNDVCNLLTFSCEHTNNTAPCDDNLFCNGDDTCSEGSCHHSGDPCTGGAECNNLCDENNDNCHAPDKTSCTDDGNVCTDDQCNGEGVCVHPPNGADCDDQDVCTFDDVCSNGECHGTQNSDCGRCTRTKGYWKTHPEAWPVDSITIGGVVYTKAEAIAILKDSNAKDATRQLAAQLIAAKLNCTAFGSCCPAIADADAFLVAHPLDSNPQGEDRQNALALKTALDTCNNSGETFCDPTHSQSQKGDSSARNTPTSPAAGMGCSLNRTEDATVGNVIELAILFGLLSLTTLGSRKIKRS